MSFSSVQRLSVSLGAVLSSVSWSALSLAAAPSATNGPKSADDIRDIRPLITIPSNFQWMIAAFLAAVVLTVGYLAVRYYRRRSQRPLSAEQRAELGLRRGEELARTGRCHEWAEVLAETLRTALAERLGWAACPDTTSELAARDWSQAPNVDATRLVELLSTCDLTRFALGQLEPGALLQSTESARAFVARLFAPTEVPVNPPNTLSASSAAQVTS